MTTTSATRCRRKSWFQRCIEHPGSVKHPQACPLRVASYPSFDKLRTGIAGGDTGGPAEPVPRYLWKGCLAGVVLRFLGR